MSQEDYLWQMLERLRGLELRSLRGKQSLQVSLIQREHRRIELVVSGRTVRRHMDEFLAIWSQLVSVGMVHVESALGGSGSSRNQPETVLAALPCVEWAILGGRKHLVLRPRDTHELGTNKQVDEFLRDRIEKDRRRALAPLVALAVCDDFSTALAPALNANAKLISLAEGSAVMVAGDRQVLALKPNHAGGLAAGVYLLSPVDRDLPIGTPFATAGGIELLRSSHPHVVKFRGALWDG